MLELERAWEALAAKVMSLANRNADLEWVSKHALVFGTSISQKFPLSKVRNMWCLTEYHAGVNEKLQSMCKHWIPRYFFEDDELQNWTGTTSYADRKSPLKKI